MQTSAGISKTPYRAEIMPRVCKCGAGAMVVGSYRQLENAERVLSGYWNIYLAFFGDQLVWLEFTITDLRDGTIRWRNGRQIKGGSNGATDSTAGSAIASG